MPQKKKQEILLESGTNELEILEFTIDGRHYGINVAKISELMKYHEVTPMPNSNPYVEGVFNPRGNMMTLINLPAYLGHPESGNTQMDIFIITNFNRVYSAFHVHAVEEIHRLSWEQIEKPDAAIYGGQDGLATGIARLGDRLITILDFEKILQDISPESGVNLDDLKNLGDRAHSDKPILMVDDSPALSKMLVDALSQAEYTNLTMLRNGEEAWELLESYKNSGHPVEKFVKMVITDIEMPRMDGHRLLKLIRDDKHLKHLPVIIFSSIINEQARVKGESLGATAQLSKPDIADLVRLVDQHILE
ncbi:MAG: chemotaxis protein [Clostridiales bacterium]|jgi:two-component system chemotaxis response regulator CheV|nr:chemotaxis protein [Clostridiales bacterium]